MMRILTYVLVFALVALSLAALYTSQTLALF